MDILLLRRLRRDLLLAAALGPCLVAGAQSAKELADKAATEGNTCRKTELWCSASKADPKNKDYRTQCENYSKSIPALNDQNIRQAKLALADGKKARAATLAGFVCSSNAGQYAEAQSIISQAGVTQTAAAPKPDAPPQLVPRDQSNTYFHQASAAFRAGDFSGAVAAASKVTDESIKPDAQDIITKVNSYNAAMSSAQQKEQSGDNAGALREYQTARSIHSSSAIESSIESLQAKLSRPAAPAPVAPPPPVQTAQVTPKNSVPAAPKAAPTPEDQNKKADKLLEEANQAAQRGDFQKALRGYDEVLHLQPANTIAEAKKAEITAQINKDPAKVAELLKQGVRDFYGAKYTETEDGLLTYLSSQSGKSKGAAAFYIAAARLCRDVLESGQKPDTAINNPQVQRYFKQAREANYVPVDRFLSPLVLRAWHSAG